MRDLFLEQSSDGESAAAACVASEGSAVNPRGFYFFLEVVNDTVRHP